MEHLKFRRARTYDGQNPHEYVCTSLEESTKLEVIRALNRYIQENGEQQMFHGMEYDMMYIGAHKYWCVSHWTEATVLLRNWDVKREDGTIDRSVTLSKRRKY